MKFRKIFKWSNDLLHFLFQFLLFSYFTACRKMWKIKLKTCHRNFALKSATKSEKYKNGGNIEIIIIVVWPAINYEIKVRVHYASYQLIFSIESKWFIYLENKYLVLWSNHIHWLQDLNLFNEKKKFLCASFAFCACKRIDSFDSTFC
jgi:hypothetical protein